MEEAGFEEIGDYFLKMHNMVVYYIVTRPILYLCKNMMWGPGTWVARRLCDKEGLGLEGARAVVTAASDGEEGM